MTDIANNMKTLSTD